MSNANLCGWVDDPRSVAETVGRWADPVLGLTVSRDFLATEHRDIFLWEQGELPIFGQPLPAHRQTIGDCVSHGWGRAIQDLILVDLAAAIADGRITQAEAAALAVQISTESVYALSRVEVGRGKLGRGDGSIGAWAGEAVVRYGVLLRKKYAAVDLSTYSGQLAKQWGNPGAGLPDDLEPDAKLFAVSRAPLVSTDDELSSALYNLFPVPVCSSQGFTETRDRYGFCDPSGTWKHCMVLRGIAKVRRGGNVVLATPMQQSWGGSPDGPNIVTLDTGREVTLPQGVFMVDFEVVVKRILKMRDSFAPAGPRGHIKRQPNFTI